MWVKCKLLQGENLAASALTYRGIAETQPQLALLLFLSFLGLVGFFVINGIMATRVFLWLCIGRPAESEL